MFEISKELEDLGKRVIQKYSELFPLKDPNSRIAYQYSEKEKTSNGKTVYADTTKISDKMKAIAPYDFLITFYKPSVEGLEQSKMEILMRHELMLFFKCQTNLIIAVHRCIFLFAKICILRAHL